METLGITIDNIMNGLEMVIPGRWPEIGPAKITLDGR